MAVIRKPSLIKRLMLLVTSMFISSCLQAQTLGVDSFSVTVEKAGNLKSVLKKCGFEKIKYLKVSGILNKKDLNVFGNEVNNIVSLYLDDAVYLITKEDRFYDQSVGFKIPSLNKIDRFYLPQYAQSKEGQKYMLYGDLIAREVAANYYSRLSIGAERLIIYPSTNNNYVPNGTFSAFGHVDIIQVPDEKFINILPDTENGLAIVGEYGNFRDFYGYTIELLEGGQKYYYINEFDGDFSTLSNIAFLNAKSFYRYLCTHSEDIQCDVVFSDKLKSIPQECFKRLKFVRSVKGDNIEIVGKEAFSECPNLKNVSFPKAKQINDKAFFKCSSLETFDIPAIEKLGADVLGETNLNLTTFIAPATLKSIDAKTFYDSNINKIEFLGSTPPNITGNVNYLNGYKFVIPKGSWRNYNIDPWNKLARKEKGKERVIRTINSTEPGTLLSQISDEEAPLIDELTISGRLYDIDLEAVSKCVNLSVLDLKDAFIVKSPETIHRELENQRTNMATGRALSALLGLAVSDAEARFRAGKGSSVEVLYAKAITNIFDKALSTSEEDIVIANDACIMPTGLGLNLDKIIYPKWLKKLYIEGGSNLTEIVFPPYLEVVDGGNYIGIKNLELPNSVKEI